MRVRVITDSDNLNVEKQGKLRWVLQKEYFWFSFYSEMLTSEVSTWSSCFSRWVSFTIHFSLTLKVTLICHRGMKSKPALGCRECSPKNRSQADAATSWAQRGRPRWAPEIVWRSDDLYRPQDLPISLFYGSRLITDTGNFLSSVL